MQPVEFNKDYARYLLQRLDRGEPIRPPTDRGWRRIDYLMLAGAAAFAVVSQGPVLRQPDLAPDQRVVNDTTFTDEVMATISFLGGVFMAVQDDLYDDQWDPIMTCVVTGIPSDVQVQPVGGWRRGGTP